MSNLGMYQTVVTLMNKHGGPLKAIIKYSGIMLTIGAAIGGGTVSFIDKAKNKYTQKTQNNRISLLDKTFTVSSPFTSDNGLNLQIGDCFRIILEDKDVRIIECIGDDTQPYVVTEDDLLRISNDYSAEMRKLNGYAQ